MKQTISVVFITKGNDEKFLFNIASNIIEKEGLKNTVLIFYENGVKRKYTVEDCKGFAQENELHYFILIREEGCEDSVGKIRNSYRVEYEPDTLFSVRHTHSYKIGRNCSEDTKL